MADRGVPVDALASEWERLANDGKTPMFVALDGKAAGIVAVADTVKPDSKTAIAALKRMGLEVVMLTGDNPRTAKAIAGRSAAGTNATCALRKANGLMASGLPGAWPQP